MEVLFPILTILGLIVFEIITSIDNAIINAEVLSGMGQKARRFFLTWGIFFSVFLVRGLLPFLILFAATPELGVIGTFTAAFSTDPSVAATIQEASHVLLIAGGIFLIFLFFHWLFLEPKYFGIKGENFFQSQGAWFYAVISLLLTGIVFMAFRQDEPLLQFGAVLGSTAFFIIHGFRQYAEAQEQKLLTGGMSDVSKIAYLEVLDASFSIDGVIGAFAFTFSIPFILIGNGIGAIILRELTIKNIERIKRYRYLKNGAMYSILFLGVVMLLHSFDVHVPEWLSPIVTFGTVGYFFNKSRKEIAQEDQMNTKNQSKKKKTKK